MTAAISLTLISFDCELPKGLITALSIERNFKVKGVYQTIRDAKKELHCLTTEITIFNIQSPNKNSMEFISWLIQINKSTKVIIISKEYEYSFLIAAIQKGVIGFLQYDTANDDILKAIAFANQGGAPVAPQIAAIILADIKHRYYKKLELRKRITEREEEICSQLVHGLSDKEIGKLLCISSHTVNHHLRSIYKKLKVKNRIEAAIRFSEK